MFSFPKNIFYFKTPDKRKNKNHRIDTPLMVDYNSILPEIILGIETLFSYFLE